LRLNRTISGISGVEAGHWTDAVARTGCTVMVFPEGAVGGGVVPGSAPGSRELGVLETEHLADRVHAFCFSGGSAFGLAAADGVMSALAERDIGFLVGPHRIPLVPTAILFDLGVASARPNAESGRLAVQSASSQPLAEGRVGAGTGATVALASGEPQPGGLGSWLIEDEGVSIAAVVALNAYGSVRDPETGRWLAGDGSVRSAAPLLSNTTLAAVATDACLTKAQANIVAQMASAGLARCLYPAYAPVDGDTVFVAATGTGGSLDAVQLARLGHLAALCVERSIVRALG
jgi:L-aminopeptidase/D-esterase-like protein